MFPLAPVAVLRLLPALHLRTVSSPSLSLSVHPFLKSTPALFLSFYPSLTEHRLNRSLAAARLLSPCNRRHLSSLSPSAIVENRPFATERGRGTGGPSLRPSDAGRMAADALARDIGRGGGGMTPTHPAAAGVLWAGNRRRDYEWKKEKREERGERQDCWKFMCIA